MYVEIPIFFNSVCDYILYIYVHIRADIPWGCEAGRNINYLLDNFNCLHSTLYIFSSGGPIAHC